MQWEIDLFGKITENAKASKAAYNVTKAEYDGVMVSLAANVAKAYIDLRMYQNHLQVSLSHLAEQKKCSPSLRLDSRLVFQICST